MSDTALIVSRDEDLLRQIDNWGRLEEADLLPMGDLSEVWSRLDELDALLLLVDRRDAQGPNPLQMIRRIRRRCPRLEVIFLESERAPRVREAEQRAGVDRFIEPSTSERDMRLILARRIRMLRFRRRSGMIGKSESFGQIIEMILQIAPTEISVLITGESGTGKELIAKTLHDFSRRREGPFLALNCGALPEGTLESELFGHEKGSFTGAHAAHPGHFERADGGTLFLDEIGEITHSVQIRLLRVLETGEFMRMGGTETLSSDVRLLAATNRDLGKDVREGRFRRDLLHRIKVFEIRIPPLRERREDIPLLVEHFIRQTHEKEGTPLLDVEPALMDVLKQAPWPGNIRELRNVVQRLCILAKAGSLSLDDLPEDVLQSEGERPGNLPVPLPVSPEDAERELIYRSILTLREDVKEVLGILRRFQSQMEGEDWPAEMMQGKNLGLGRDLSGGEALRSLEDMEKDMIRRALEESHGHRRRAADQLGISERTLYRKIKEYGLQEF